MKILLPCIIDLNKSAPNRPHHLIEYLSKKHEITAVCLNDWWKGAQGNAAVYFKNFNNGGDPLTIRYITDRKISPILQEVFSPQLMDTKNLDDFDVIFNYNTLRSGYYLSKLLNLPMVYDIADDLPAMIGNSPQIPSFFRGAGKWFGEKMVHRTISRSDAVSATAEAFKDIYSVSDEKFHCVPNGVDTSRFRLVETSIRKDLGLTSNFVLGYVGVLREWVDFMPVYHALKKLDDTKLLIVGQEGLYKENQEMVKNLGIGDKVIFTGNVSYADVPKYIAAMDVCLIPFRDNDISHNAVPLKLFEYMACEKPIISTSLAGVKSNAGERILYCDTSEEFYSTILKLEQGDLPMDFLKNNRAYIEMNYEWNAIGTSVERILESVV